MNEESKKVFTPGPMISFRSARKLSSYLVRQNCWAVPLNEQQDHLKPLKKRQLPEKYP